MTLTVLERLACLSVLPSQGSFTTLKILRQLREKLSFTEDELKVLNFREEGEKTVWDGGVEAEFTFEAAATKLIRDALTKASGEERLTQDHYSLYEKFIE